MCWCFMCKYRGGNVHTGYGQQLLGNGQGIKVNVWINCKKLYYIIYIILKQNIEKIEEK